ncbi:hypothetical protein [Desulfoluna butyratoxydans]|uniref:Restriction endonuclease type ii-like n=1 Tax=Desulfoluna butyratoxydans TaxID=231438 RepID=A0A4U8YIK6_9BACT|nr:hypothetical protein [Desulfoluna butyratoxydans]VFQ43167.1 restriction endonuclease type ii-like [Desulfoluna butyratoxydans]
MAGLKVLGVEDLTRRAMVESLATLVVFGAASSAVYDLWTVILGLMTGTVPGWAVAMVRCLVPLLGCVGWFMYIYKRYIRYAGNNETGETNGEVLPHKGVVLMMSTPKSGVEEIMAQIETKSLDELYGIQGIGQLFKGVFSHKERLRHVWPIVNRESAGYTQCLTAFLEKYIPQAKVVKNLRGNQKRFFVEKKGEQKEIEAIKSLVNEIYSPQMLHGLGLSKSDVIVDISGGTKHMTIGLILGALDASIDIQYTEQNTKKVIPLAIDHRMILDKTIGYLTEHYQQMTNPDAIHGAQHNDSIPDYQPV